MFTISYFIVQCRLLVLYPRDIFNHGTLPIIFYYVRYCSISVGTKYNEVIPEINIVSARTPDLVLILNKSSGDNAQW